LLWRDEVVEEGIVIPVDAVVVNPVVNPVEFVEKSCVPFRENVAVGGVVL
jgi:hypothetical protein